MSSFGNYKNLHFFADDVVIRVRIITNCSSFNGLNEKIQKFLQIKKARQIRSFKNLHLHAGYVVSYLLAWYSFLFYL